MIADDSMGGRNTPSRGLEKTAAYLADNYRSWGLVPMGDSGTFFQRYTLARIRPKSAGSYIELKHGMATDRLGFEKWATVSGPMTGVPITGPVKIISGAVMPADIAPLTLAGAIVVFIQNPERPTENQQVIARPVAERPGGAGDRPEHRPGGVPVAS